MLSERNCYGGSGCGLHATPAFWCRGGSLLKFSLKLKPSGWNCSFTPTHILPFALHQSSQGVSQHRGCPEIWRVFILTLSRRADRHPTVCSTWQQWLLRQLQSMLKSLEMLSLTSQDFGLRKFWTGPYRGSKPAPHQLLSQGYEQTSGHTEKFQRACLAICSALCLDVTLDNHLQRADKLWSTLEHLFLDRGSTSWKVKTNHLFLHLRHSFQA